MSEIDDDSVFEVDRILAEKGKGRHTLYLVKWKGYKVEESTWEPASSFNDSTTFKKWERAKKRGDALAGEVLKDIERRITAYRRRSTTKTYSKELSSLVEGTADPLPNTSETTSALGVLNAVDSGAQVKDHRPPIRSTIIVPESEADSTTIVQPGESFLFFPDPSSEIGPITAEQHSHDLSQLSNSDHSFGDVGTSGLDESPSNLRDGWMVEGETDHRSHDGESITSYNPQADPRLQAKRLHMIEKQSMSDQQHSKYHHYLSAMTDSSIEATFLSWNESYSYLRNVWTAKDTIDQSTVLFYICFTQSFPLEAASIKRWLLRSVKAEQIFDDCGAGEWTKLHNQARTTPTIIFFHHYEGPYHKLMGLGELLNLNHVQCYSLVFGRHETNNTATLCGAKVLFPHGTTFLLTENNIIHDTKQASFILDFFAKRKKPGWKVMLRPNIRTWLLHVTTLEKSPERQLILFELLMCIDSLIDQVAMSEDQTLHPDEQLPFKDFGAVPSTYVIVPSLLSGYSDTSTSKNAIDERDNILIDYFCGYASMMADSCRRFWIFRRNKAIPNSGHVFVENPDKFVHHHQ